MIHFMMNPKPIMIDALVETRHALSLLNNDAIADAFEHKFCS